jgi:uncharacterized damage-inducible protein DinB
MPEVLIQAAFARTMAAYNAEMNRRLYDAAGRLSHTERTKDRGAFWNSIEGTLAHILWGDRNWMSRFDGWPKPDVGLKDSASGYGDFETLSAARNDADRKIIAWAQGLTPEWLAEDLVWFSGAAMREIRLPKSLLVTHFFNHQTHHRGQTHAMITAAGEKTGDTDLFLVVR